MVYAVEFSFYWQLISDLLSFKYFTFSYIIYHLLNRESSYILASTCNNSPVYLVLLEFLFCFLVIVKMRVRHLVDALVKL